jgi:hypothetical protein
VGPVENFPRDGLELPADGVHNEEVILILPHHHNIINICLHSLLKVREGHSRQHLLQPK